MKETIMKTKQTYAKNADSVDIIHDDNLEFQIDDQLLFEVMLMDIRSATSSFATVKKKEMNKTGKNFSLKKLIC